MAKVSIARTDSVFDRLEELRRRIEQRAYELFRHRGGASADPVGDWLTAEQELVWKPAVELREKNGTFTVLAALAGVEPKNVSIDMTADELIIEAETSHTHSETEGHVHRCEFTSGRLFRSVHFPKPVDPAKAKAEFRHGLLTVTVPAAASRKPVGIRAT